MTVSFAQIHAYMSARYLADRNHVKQAQEGMFKRPEAWFHEQSRGLEIIAAARDEMEFLAANETAYLAWASGRGRKAA